MKRWTKIPTDQLIAGDLISIGSYSFFDDLMI